MVIRNKDLKADIRKARGQSDQTPNPLPTRERKKESTPYESFIRKYNDLENNIDSLGTRDLVYYFREIAQEQGYKYVISNIKKDMAIMKRLRENFSNSEICGMIEFLYMSEQTYISKDRCSINILSSRWINTIYADMKLWVEDKYHPNKPTKKMRGEFNDDSNSTVIGGEL